ncbi:restriction endonuclease subunit S [Scandinavium lactucae]|uniref:Restriction endonuclease subunit S n=1 Tax=Scandinavium lactucae TaxID=3095028 RepID=A0ABU4QIF8_9ENTR|nr:MULTISPECIES: restriction endonuclease subunit S [unclassified Scandinavium]MDX6038687.1 restriction endonuclease subunit S [Scandinavium sp. V105_6]MDX6049357.1 restriction endonuclease subunit S [Scandinavium sp. V105_1]
MMDNLVLMPKHEAYKSSGVEWLGDIPSSWNLKPGVVAFTENKRSNKGMKENIVLSLSYGNIVIKPEEKLVGLVPESFETYQLVEPGDIIIRCTDLQNDKVSLRTGLAKDKGIITSAYLNLSVKNGFNSRFLHYYLYSLDTTKVLYKFGSGLRQNLSFLDFKRLPVFDIPETTQIKIADFLDKKIAQIDEAVTIKEQEINLLKERKQIIIQKSVTQGLDPNVPMKDSGVDWIGTIPEHWETERSRWLFRERKEKARKSDEQLTASQKYGVISQQKFMELEGRRVTQVELNFDILKHVEENDFVISMRSFQGGIEYCAYTGCVSSAYVPLIPCELVHSPYYKHLLKSQRYIEALQCTSNLVRDGQALRYENFCMVDLLIVPFEEQVAIANFIDNQEKLFLRNITIMKDQIEKLKEYKTTLINSAVTGKIKITQEMVGQ